VLSRFASAPALPTPPGTPAVTATNLMEVLEVKKQTSSGFGCALRLVVRAVISQSVRPTADDPPAPCLCGVRRSAAECGCSCSCSEERRTGTGPAPVWLVGLVAQAHRPLSHPPPPPQAASTATAAVHMRDLQCESKLHLIGQAPRSCSNIFVDCAAPRSSDGLWQQGCRECRGGVGGMHHNRKSKLHQSHATKLMADQTSWPCPLPIHRITSSMRQLRCRLFPFHDSRRPAKAPFHEVVVINPVRLQCCKGPVPQANGVQVRCGAWWAPCLLLLGGGMQEVMRERPWYSG
jgi:hypothetical protein